MQYVLLEILRFTTQVSGSQGSKGTSAGRLLIATSLTDVPCLHHQGPACWGFLRQDVCLPSHCLLCRYLLSCLASSCRRRWSQNHLSSSSSRRSLERSAPRQGQALPALKSKMPALLQLCSLQLVGKLSQQDLNQPFLTFLSDPTIKFTPAMF